MPVSNDRKYTKEFVVNLLESVKDKTLGEVDKSHQFVRTIKSEKITGIAGDVVEQSVFGYERDSKQECDIEIDGVLTELKTTGVRVPKSDLKCAKGKIGYDYNLLLGAKEGISITGVTFEPDIQTDFWTSHFWEKSEHLLIVFYEYKSYDVVPASAYANFPIVDYCFNTFTLDEQEKLRNDWEIVRDFLQGVYSRYTSFDERYEYLEGFTHLLRPNLLLIELVPGFKKRGSGSYQKPRYRLKQTFVDSIVRGHFSKSKRAEEVSLKKSFSSFAELDKRCHQLTLTHKGKTIRQLKQEFGIESDSKSIVALIVIGMFDAECKRLNQISDFTKVGIIVKTVTLREDGKYTEAGIKLQRVDFEEWANRDVDFEHSVVYQYFCEHSFLCPIFCEHDAKDPEKTTFEGFKRFAFDENFIYDEVKRMWQDSRNLIHRNSLVWEYEYDNSGNKRVNGSGAYMGAPNLPKSVDYTVFFRGGASVSTEATRTECVNGIHMLPQYFWLKSEYLVGKLKEISFL